MQSNGTAVRQIAPHGGVLVDRLRVTGSEAEALRERAKAAPQVKLSEVSLSDLELIATGVISPLTGFMTSDNYRSVVNEMHLTNGLPWTIPVVLPVDQETAGKLPIGHDVALVNQSGEIVGLLALAEKYPYDKVQEAQHVYRTTEEAHPGVARLYHQGE